MGPESAAVYTGSVLVSARPSTTRLESLEKESGMGPEWSRQPPTRRDSSSSTPPSDAGSSPERQLSKSSRLFNHASRLPSSAGMGPVSWLELRISNIILLFVPVDGMSMRLKTSVRTDPKLTVLLKDGKGAVAGRACNLFLALGTCNDATPSCPSWKTRATRRGSWWSTKATTRSSNEHPRKVLQSRGMQSLSNSSQLIDMIRPAPRQIVHLAAYESYQAHGDVYTGAMGTFDVYGFPYLVKGQSSSSQIWVINKGNGESDNVNKITSGWEINPDIYGDSKTHFFVFWTVDGEDETGCYNLNCVGFVPVNGAPITPGDTPELPHGQTRIYIRNGRLIMHRMYVSRDDGDWWLYYGNDNLGFTRVGYWPKNLFNTLSDNATLIGWGGMTTSYEGHPSPPMGNGNFASKRSAMVQNVQYVDTSGRGYDPPTWPAPLHIVVSDNCYSASLFVDGTFHYGGPGGCFKPIF
ncbi:hypothetical protein ACQ4PT_060594 [Festuca glaucescens]